MKAIQTNEITENEILTAIKQYDMRVSGNDIDYIITDCIESGKEPCALYLFENEDEGIKSSALVWDSGEVFVLDDWQGSRPENLSELEDYRWRTTDGQIGVNLFGYPRILGIW